VDVAVLERRNLFGILGNEGRQQRPQILQIEQQQPFFVGERKAMLSTPSCVSLRSRRRDSSSGPISEIGRADRMALLAEQIPEDHRELILKAVFGSSRFRRRA
jgi:hypothetical protein